MLTPSEGIVVLIVQVWIVLNVAVDDVCDARCKIAARVSVPCAEVIVDTTLIWPALQAVLVARYIEWFLSHALKRERREAQKQGEEISGKHIEVVDILNSDLETCALG
jgi:hypothetical protein